MLASTFATPDVLALGGATGLVFGFLLQKGGVTNFRVIVGQFLLKDFTMLKVMISAIVVGGAGIYGMRAYGMDIKMHIKAATLLANALGGLVFGVGMALLGYCPGTAVGAIGEGSRHAIAGVLGMIGGSALFAGAYPWIKANILGVGDIGKATLDSVTGLSPWWFILGILAAAVVGFTLLEGWEKLRRPAG